VTQAVDSTLRDTQFQRILLIKPSALGDVIHTLPILVKLRNRYPQARIDWLLTPPIAELVGRHPALSNVLIFDRQAFKRFSKTPAAVLGLTRLVRDIRKVQYDLVIDLHGQLRSAFFTLSSGAPVRIGFDRPRIESRSAERHVPPEAYRHGWTGAREGSWMAYSHHISVPTLDVHAVERYLGLVPMLGLDEGEPDFQVPVPAEASAQVETLLQRHGHTCRPLAVLFPGTLWETKHWRIDGYAQVAGHLLRSGLSVILAGSAKERSRCQAVAAACSGVLDLCGQSTLSQLAALIQRAQICVTNDSGPMHLAVALDRPVVSIFGPTDPLWIGPYRRPEAVVRVDLPCAPCYLRQLSKCPHDHACMNQVTAAAVIGRIGQILAQPAVNC
jgi:lipopolysaccharide heptosyltransferase I